ncbi:MAG: fused response regulator/phosphatase [Betaproteobacteria bacterium]
MDAPVSSRAAALSSPATSVLVVDDVEDNRELLAARLAALGLDDITMAVDGREALALIARRPFDLVLLDMMMPHVNGIQVLEALREQGRLESMPVIMVSASGEMPGVVRCIELGAEDYLTKPINATLLRARIGATLEKKRLRDALRARLAQSDHELLTARELQLGMVPEDFVAPDGALAIHLLLEPARHVGGDLCDYFVGRDGALWFAIGDVSGKGAAAAIFMARTWACLRAIAMRDDAAGLAPGEVLTAINRELCEANASSMFTTLFVGRLERASGRVAYSNAGHMPPFHLDRNGNSRQLDTPPRPPVGAWPEADYPSGLLQLAAGDALFAYSDGLTEAMRGDREQWGEERLSACLAAGTAVAGGALLASLLEAVREFAGDQPQTDDIAALLLRWKN